MIGKCIAGPINRNLCFLEMVNANSRTLKGWDGVMEVSKFKSQFGQKKLPIKK